MLSAQCNKCQNVHACNERHDWDEDAISDSDFSRCPKCSWASYQLVGEEDEVAASWWSVGLYQIYEAYGGSEEGGWYYQTGNMNYPEKQRIFENYYEAEAYCKNLREEIDTWGQDDLAVQGFTNSAPPPGWPKRRPSYS